MSTKAAHVHHHHHDPMVKIGVDIEGVNALRDTLLQILKVDACGDAPKVAAIEALSKLAKIEHVTITGCSFTSK